MKKNWFKGEYTVHWISPWLLLITAFSDFFIDIAGVISLSLALGMLMTRLIE